MLPRGCSEIRIIEKISDHKTDDNLYTTFIPAKSEAGTYYVWYKVVGDDNYNSTDPEYVIVTINPATHNNDKEVRFNET